jgi:hypothetical protein
MIPSFSTTLSQGFPPIPAVCQKIDLAGDWEMKLLKHLFNQVNFGSKRAASFSSFRVIKVGPEGQQEVFVEKRKEDPLVAKDMGSRCSIFMPGTSRHLSACLFGNGVIHDDKEDRMGVDSQMMKEFRQGALCDLFHRPNILSEESRKA